MRLADAASPRPLQKTITRRTGAFHAKTVLWAVGSAAGLTLCLFGGSIAFQAKGVLGDALRIVQDIFHTGLYQCVILTVLAAYIVVFTLPQFRKSRIIFGFACPEPWLWGAMMLCLSRYAIEFPSSASSTQTLVFVGSIFLGSLARLWVVLYGASSGNSRNVSTFLLILVALLATGSFLQSNAGFLYRYADHVRWSGLWYNPNLASLLMAVGIIVAIGLFYLLMNNPERDAAERELKTRILVRRSAAVSLLIAIAAMTRALLIGYSRGAWLSTAVGIGYFLFRIPKAGIASTFAENSTPPQKEKSGFAFIRVHSWLRNNWGQLLVIGVSVMILTFWQSRSADWRLVRRLYSLGNVNDFSWRNRVVAWVGELRVIADHPWFGAGFQDSEKLYGEYYSPPRLTEGGAIQLNDYLMLGATNGTSALFCLLMYIWTSLANPQCGARGARLPAVLSAECGIATVCRAGAIVLFVGFSFDGGLFRLASGSVFWILLELGRVDVQSPKPKVQRQLDEQLQLTEFKPLSPSK